MPYFSHMNTFSVGAMIKFGWETFKKRPWFFIGAYVLVMILSMIPGQIASMIAPAGQDVGAFAGIIALVFSIIGVFANIYYSMGTTAFALKAHDDAAGVKLMDMWHPHPIVAFVIAGALYGLAVICGLILLIVPGIIVSLMLMFGTYVVIDRNAKAMDALRESRRITRGHLWQLFVFGLALVLLNFVGLLVLVVGLLVTMPVSAFAVAHAYRTLERMAPEVVA